MGEMFDIAELLRVGVNDERSGVAFYAALAKKAEDPELRRTFAELADEERSHQQRFEAMLADVGEHRDGDRYDGEYGMYLKAMTDMLAFEDEDTAERMANDCVDDAAAVALALSFERSTLNLMHEMKDLVPAKDREVVQQLIDEERSHVVTLARAAERLQQ